MAVIYGLFGFGGLVWAGALRTVWVWHITWFVNSASHVWGTQAYKTGEFWDRGCGPVVEQSLLSATATAVASVKSAKNSSADVSRIVILSFA